MLEKNTKTYNLTADDVFAVKPVIITPEKLESEFEFGKTMIKEQEFVIDEKLIERINLQARKSEMIKFYFGIGYFVLLAAALITLFL